MADPPSPNPIVIPNGYGLVSYKWLITGRDNPISCGHGYKSEDTTQESADTLNANIQGSDSLVNADHMNQGMRYIGCVVHQRNSSGDLEAAEATANVVGTVAQNMPIINSTMLISTKTALVGSSYRGRMYPPIIGFEESNVDALGNISPSAFSDVEEYVQGWWDAVSTGGIDPYLLHSYTKSGVLPAPTKITGFLLKGKVATQRRRIR